MMNNSSYEKDNEIARELFGFHSIDQFSKQYELEKVILRIGKYLENKNNPWKERDIALQLLQLLAESSMNNSLLHDHLSKTILKDTIQKLLSVAFIEQIEDNRSEITKETSQAIQLLCYSLKRKFIKISKRILPTFLKTVGKSNEVIQQHCYDSIIKIIEYCHSYKIIESIFKAYQTTKNSNIQENCIIFFKVILRVWPIKQLLKTHQCSEFESFINIGLSGKTVTIRHTAAKCFWYYNYHFPKRMESFKHSITSRKMSIIEKQQMNKIQDFETINQLTSTSFIINHKIPNNYTTLSPYGVPTSHHYEHHHDDNISNNNNNTQQFMMSPNKNNKHTLSGHQRHPQSARLHSKQQRQKQKQQQNQLTQRQYSLESHQNNTHQHQHQHQHQHHHQYHDQETIQPSFALQHDIIPSSSTNVDKQEDQQLNQNDNENVNVNEHDQLEATPPCNIFHTNPIRHSPNHQDNLLPIQPESQQIASPIVRSKSDDLTAETHQLASLKLGNNEEDDDDDNIDQSHSYDENIKQNEKLRLSSTAPLSGRFFDSQQNDNNINDPPMSPSIMSDYSEVESVFQVNFDEFKINGFGHYGHNENINENENENENDNIMSPDKSLMDNSALELHTEWSLFKSQTYDSLNKVEQIMNTVQNQNDMQNVNGVLDVLRRHKRKLDFMMDRFQSSL